MSKAGCPLCAASLQRWDVACNLVEQAAKGLLVSSVPELTEVAAAAAELLGLDAGVLEPGVVQPPGYLARLDQRKAERAAAIRGACLCAGVSP